MKTNVSLVGAVLASILFLVTSAFQAGAAASVYVKNVTLLYLPNPSISIPSIIIGKHVCVPGDLFMSNPEAFKLSFEIYKFDGTSTSDISRLNFIRLGVMSFVDKNGDIHQQVSNTGVYKNLASLGVVYTDGVTTPNVNLGMHIVPLDENNKVIPILVGSLIADPNPYLMNNGSFKVHSNAAMKVHRVKIENMPLIFDDITRGVLTRARQNNPGAQLSLNIELTLTMHAYLDIQNGCSYVPAFNSSDSRPWVHFDTLQPYGKSFQPRMVDPTTLLIPAGFGSSYDLYESETPSELGKRVDLARCRIEMGAIPRSIPPDPTTIIVSGLNNQGSKKFYTLRTRVP